MPVNTRSLFEITEVVHDRMQVLIKCPVLKKSLLRYCISNIHQHCIRKGSFLGESIQLNLLHMPDGDYFFKLTTAEGPDYALPFYKRSYNSESIILNEY